MLINSKQNAQMKRFHLPRHVHLKNQKFISKLQLIQKKSLNTEDMMTTTFSKSAL